MLIDSVKLRDRILLLETRGKFGVMVSRDQLMRVIKELEQVRS